MAQNRIEQDTDEADALRTTSPLGAILYLLVVASLVAAILPGTVAPAGHAVPVRARPI